MDNHRELVAIRERGFLKGRRRLEWVITVHCRKIPAEVKEGEVRMQVLTVASKKNHELRSSEQTAWWIAWDIMDDSRISQVGRTIHI